jgi:glutamyl-tRNA synthetase
VFSIDEMVAAFDVIDVNPNPARFDVKKAESINGDHIRMLTTEDFAERLLPYLGDLVKDDADRSMLLAAAPLVQERMQLLGEAPDLLAFLFTADDELQFAADAMPGDEGSVVLEAAASVLPAVAPWNTEAIEAALRVELVETRGLKPRVAFGPLRTAISGRRISPPLFESMELLGREHTLARIERLRAAL